MTYDEFLKSLDVNGRTHLDMSNDKTTQNINEIMRYLKTVPSHVFSMMYPRIKFTVGDKVIKLFYKPRQFPSGTGFRHEDRGGYIGLKTFTMTSNEINGLNKQTTFEMSFDISDSRMLVSGHPNYPELIEFFKVSRSEPLIMEYGWGMTGIKEVDEVISKLGSTYKINLNASNWSMVSNADRTLTIVVKGWCGITKRDFSDVFVCGSRVPKLVAWTKEIEGWKKQIESDMSKNIKNKNSTDVLHQKIKGVNDKLRKAFVGEYSKVKKEWSKGNKSEIEFKNIVKTMSVDLEQLSRDRNINIFIVLGKYNKTRADVKKTDEIAEIKIPIKEIFDKHLITDTKKSVPMQFEPFLQELVNEYIGNDDFLFNVKKPKASGGAKTPPAKAQTVQVGSGWGYTPATKTPAPKPQPTGKATKSNTPKPSERTGIAPQVKINYIPYNNNLYIVIDDINRYYNALDVKNTLGMSLSEKLKVAKDNNIPIIDLEAMNTLISYPVTMHTNVDEALQSNIMYKQYQEKREKEKKEKSPTDSSPDIDLNLPYQFFAMNAPFGMWGNFILKPFQAIFITWGSETFDRFYIITKMTHTITEQGQFMANYETVHASY